jgi:hypothetical protein
MNSEQTPEEIRRRRLRNEQHQKRAKDNNHSIGRMLDDAYKLATLKQLGSPQHLSRKG